jgi:hypothetical protein
MNKLPNKFHVTLSFEMSISNTLNKPRNTGTILELIYSYTYFFSNKDSHLEVQCCS